MPVYVYRNLRTGATFEVEQRMSDPALSADPVSGDPVKRLIQPVGIAFKGSGFYVNDSRSGSTRRGGDATKSEGAKTEGAKAEGAKTEGAKPESAAASSDAPKALPPSAPSAASASAGAAD